MMPLPDMNVQRAFDFTLDDVLDKADDADGTIKPIKELTGTPPTSVSTKLKDVGKTMRKAEGIHGLVFSFGMRNNHMELGLEGTGDDDSTFHLSFFEYLHYELPEDVVSIIFGIILELQHDDCLV
ncbi:hypothetical protein Tco_0957965 [Tanacetum coccineum]